MYFYDYPKVKHSLARTALQDPYPALYIDTRGVIRGANLMAFWLWNTLQLTESIRPDTLLGRSIFSIYTKKSSIVKRMKAGSNSESPIYDLFIDAMKTNSQLKKMYEQAQHYPDNEWENPLSIMPPAHIEKSRLLDFQITTHRLEGDAGFLCMYTPTGSTLHDVEEQYRLLIEKFGDNAYVQLDDQSLDTIENSQQLATFGTHFRTYYPALIQDPLWYIGGENKAHQLKEEHEFHAEYEQTMMRLLQLQDFRYMLEVARKLPIRLYIPDNTEAPFYTCRVILPCLYPLKLVYSSGQW